MVKFEKKQPTKQELDDLGVFSWGTWTSPAPPGFDWEYDGKETFYVLEGDAEIISGDDKIQFSSGDLVTVYPETGSCHWNVTKTIKKHYRFG